MPIASSGGARICRRIVTHNHQRTDFETLTRTPDDLLRHIGSPFAPDKEATQPHTHAVEATGKQ
jgi:hypothetical protein